MVCLLFFDIDTAERHEYNEIDYIHCFMPLFRAFLDIIIGMVEIMVCFICLLIFPIFAIFIILFGILRFIVRYIYDCFMMIVRIKLLFIVCLLLWKSSLSFRMFSLETRWR